MFSNCFRSFQICPCEAFKRPQNIENGYKCQAFFYCNGQDERHDMYSRILSTLLKQKRNLTGLELTFIAAVTEVTSNPHDRAGNEVPRPTNNINRGKHYYLHFLAGLCEGIRKERRELRKGRSWVLHQHNAPTHSALPVKRFLAKYRIPVLDYAFYQLDLSLWDFFLFPKVKSALKEIRLSPLKLTTRGLLAMDHVILNHGQVTWTTPELASPLLTTTPHQQEDVSALDRFNVHRCPTRRVLGGSGLELVTRQAMVRYL
ncbi:uncharacterized protein TNCV_5101191 [Trichonephila clavipes]|nr:uncharacterized protein TNCV_5101191 [Trichonephila clavipes]